MPFRTVIPGSKNILGQGRYFPYASNVPNGMSGITDVFGFGETFPFANTEAKAVQNLYVRLNYNYNHDEYGTKKYKVYPTEAYSKTLVGKTVKEYRIRAGAGSCLTTANINAEAGKQIIRQVATATGASEPVTSQILRELYYATRDGNTGSISEEVLCPGWQKNPTSDQVANYNNQKKLEEEAAKNLQECGFFCRIGNSAADLVGAPATAAKLFSVAIPVSATFVVCGLAFIIFKKMNEVDTNQAIKEQHRTTRAVAPATAAAVMKVAV